MGPCRRFGDYPDISGEQFLQLADGPLAEASKNRSERSSCSRRSASNRIPPVVIVGDRDAACQFQTAPRRVNPRHAVIPLLNAVRQDLLVVDDAGARPPHQLMPVDLWRSSGAD